MLLYASLLHKLREVSYGLSCVSLQQRTEEPRWNQARKRAPSDNMFENISITALNNLNCSVHNVCIYALLT